MPMLSAHMHKHPLSTTKLISMWPVAIQIHNTKGRDYMSMRHTEETLLEKEESLSSTDLEQKAGATYKLTGKHLFDVNAAYVTKAPSLRNTFSNSREKPRRSRRQKWRGRSPKRKSLQ